MKPFTDYGVEMTAAPVSLRSLCTHSVESCRASTIAMVNEADGDVAMQSMTFWGVMNGVLLRIGASWWLEGEPILRARLLNECLLHLQS